MSNSSTSQIFSYLAPAKVNLCLNIGKKQLNGYHELASVVGFTEFGDTITIQISNKDHLVLSGPFSENLPTNINDNLIIKSVKKLRRLKHKIPPLKITVDKQIPVGGGLGGGSSDAATIFTALNNIFNLNISRAYLEKITVKIGADIPVCLNRTFVVMRGIGDQITPISNSYVPQYVVLANPGSIVDTKSVFEKFDDYRREGNTKNIPKNLNIKRFLESGNDLQNTAKKTYPEVEILLNTMTSLYPTNYALRPSCIKMSGSGSSCFALFEDAVTANTYCHNIQKAGFWSVSTKFISKF